MDLIKLDGSYGKKKCRITVSEEQFLIEGDFYYLKNDIKKYGILRVTFT